MEAGLRAKIIELFEYRKLPNLIKFSNDSWDETFYERLIQLQYEIYRLDHELESNWEVSESLITERWEAIYDALTALGIPSSKHDEYCSHIYKYQRHELEIRKEKLPTRLSMEYFYFYKSCDVKLLRRIIYDNNSALSKVLPISRWRIFDLVTEVNDDVEDIEEDTSTINGNRFLIHILEKGKISAKNEFVDFLIHIGERNAKLDALIIDNFDFKEYTREQIKSTITLVDEQLSQIDKLDVTAYEHLSLVSTM